MKYLIVGLGNIGPEYQDTRHNIGFNVLDAFAKASNAVFEDMRYGAVCEMKLKGRTLVLLKPNTYMNLSGKAVSYWMQKEKIALEDLLVIVDDLALPFGKMRLTCSPKPATATKRRSPLSAKSPDTSATDASPSDRKSVV